MNRIAARIVDLEARKVNLLEMTCPWIENRAQKNQEKTSKYMHHCGGSCPNNSLVIRVTQHNIMMDVLGGYLKDTAKSAREMLGMQKAEDALLRMQKAVTLRALHIDSLGHCKVCAALGF